MTNPVLMRQHAALFAQTVRASLSAHQGNLRGLSIPQSSVGIFLAVETIAATHSATGRPRLSSFGRRHEGLADTPTLKKEKGIRVSSLRRLFRAGVSKAAVARQLQIGRTSASRIPASKK